MRIKKIKLLTVEQVIYINKQIVSQEKQRHICLDKGKIDSALGSAFYPGNYPFRYGGIAKVAGALCYFITKAHAFLDGNKRTAGLVATLLMERNHFELIYPFDMEKETNEFAEIIDHAAANKITKDQLITWFDQHKRLIYNA